jgi:hypothetical protein
MWHQGQQGERLQGRTAAAHAYYASACQRFAPLPVCAWTLPCLMRPCVLVWLLHGRWPDWDVLAEACGLDCFLAVPLHCANQDMGALLVTSSSPVTLDRYLRKLASDLGHALSQALYTLACIGQMRAGDQIIHDILPEKVSFSC